MYIEENENNMYGELKTFYKKTFNENKQANFIKSSRKMRLSSNGGLTYKSYIKEKIKNN